MQVSSSAKALSEVPVELLAELTPTLALPLDAAPQGPALPDSDPRTQLPSGQSADWDNHRTSGGRSMFVYLSSGEVRVILAVERLEIDDAESLLLLRGRQETVRLPRSDVFYCSFAPLSAPMLG
jgi:hypothetical protein